MAVANLPTVHLNGTPRDVLVQQRCDVLYHLRSAEVALQEACPNGRDYYLVPGSMELALQAHRDRLATLCGLIHEIEAEAMAISDL